MDASLASLGLWQGALLALAVVLGLLAADLLYSASRAARPWRERALALVPAAVFGWVLLAARSVRAADDYWQSYLAFQAAHYDPNHAPFFYQQNQRDMASALPSASRMGWIAVGLAAATLALGVVPRARWSGYRWPMRGWRAAASHRRAPGLFPAGDEVEMTIEPLERPRGER